MHHFFVENYHASGLWPQFWGSFFGAFLAFLFGLISYFLIKRYERFTLHKSAIVKLERELNYVLDLNFLNSVLVEHLNPILKSKTLSFDRFQTIDLVPNISTELASLDLINSYFEYERNIDRLNLHYKSINHGLNRFEEVLIAGSLLPAQNFDTLLGGVSAVGKTINETDQSVKKLLCIVRIYIKIFNKENSFYLSIIKNKWQNKITDLEIKEEMEILNKEIEEIKSKSEVK